MKIGQLFNPFHLYRNRKRIIPYLERSRNNWKLGRFKDRHYGQRCFVIGNGPSLALSDLDRLQQEITFASNKIYLIFNQTEWRPTYLVLEDDHILSQNHMEIRQLRGFTKFINDNCKHLFRGNRDTIWYPWRPTKRGEYPKFSGDSLTSVYRGCTVTYISLQLAYFMGFTRVYLIGVDHNYSLVYQGQPIVEHSPQHGQDHFIPNYFQPGEKRWLPRLDLAEQAFQCAKEFYEAHGRKIFNATRGGKLEVFDRVSFEEVLLK